MATSKMALRKMREICLSLPDVGEAQHFGESCFYVGKRIFATCGDKAGVCRLVVQLEPQHASRLLDADPRFVRWGKQKDYVVLDAAKLNNWDELRALVFESYRLNEPESDTPMAASRKGRTAKKARRKRA